LTVFSDRAWREIQEGGAKLFTFTGGDQQAIKDVLDWIMKCVEEKKAVHFQTVRLGSCSYSFQPAKFYAQYDESTPKLYTKYALAIEAADYLGIPARDFAEGLTKRLIGIARKNLMSWEEVEYFYTKYEDNGLSQVAAASVFFGWWRGELDEEKTPDDMSFLSVLREQIPALDEDLHEWAAKNEADIRAKWSKKDEEKRAGMTSGGGGGDGWNNDDSGAGFSAEGGGGWDTVDSGATVSIQGEWDQSGDTGGGGGGKTAAGNEWNKENAAPTTSSGGGTPAPTASSSGWDDNSANGNDWAEEMIEQQAPTW
jgi:hypothetical protein